MSDFKLIRPPVLAGAAVLRDEPLRRDTRRQQEGWQTAQVVLVDHQGRGPVDWPAPPAARTGDAAPAGTGGAVTASTGGFAVLDTGPRLRTRAATAVGTSPPADALLLGEAEGVTYWAMRAGPEDLAGDTSRWMTLFSAGAELPALDAALLAAAIALLNWHDRARFCTRDGSPTRLTNAGWARICEANQHEEYPRTDPAVICLVHDRADRVLLARQPSWPAGRYSVLAGFVEAGESLEACVAREIAEEVGIDVTGISYLGSQAWPFPRSLMVGFHAVADPDQPLRLDESEISDALWVSHDELRPALARDDWGTVGEATGQILLPGRLSIARTMIDSWAASR